MKKRLIFICLLLLSVSFAMAVDDYYQLGLQYTNRTIAERSLKVIPLLEKPLIPSGEYSAVILTSNNNSLLVTNFSFQNELFYESWDESTGEISDNGVIILSDVKMDLFLPYFKNGALLVILSPNLQKLTINVSSFSMKTEIVETVSGTNTFLSNKTSATVPTSELESLPQQSVSEKPSEIVAVAKGVGLGIGIIVLAILLIVWWKGRRK